MRKFSSYLEHMSSNLTRIKRNMHLAAVEKITIATCCKYPVAVSFSCAAHKTTGCTVGVVFQWVVHFFSHVEVWKTQLVEFRRFVGLDGSRPIIHGRRHGYLGVRGRARNDLRDIRVKFQPSLLTRCFEPLGFVTQLLCYKNTIIQNDVQ